MKQENDATTRVKKYSELRKDIKNMTDTGSFTTHKGNKDEDYAPTRTIPINNNEMMDTEALDMDDNSNHGDKKFKDAPIFKSYQKKKLFITILYCVAGAIVLGLLIWLIVWIATKL